MLQSRRVALVGMAQGASPDIKQLLEDNGASYEDVSVDASTAGLLDSFDAVLLRIDDANHSDAHCTLVHSCEAPLLLIASESTISSLRDPLHRAGRDFAFASSSTHELLLRLATLVPRDEAMATVSVGNIVVADDDLVSSGLLRAALTKLGFTCHMARDGQAALNLAKQLRPAGMVLDVEMPRRNGISVLQAIKLDPATVHTRVLLVTGTAQADAVRRASTLGADAFIVKPFKAADVAQRLQRLITQGTEAARA